MCRKYIDKKLVKKVINASLPREMKYTYIEILKEYYRLSLFHFLSALIEN